MGTAAAGPARAAAHSHRHALPYHARGNSHGPKEESGPAAALVVLIAGGEEKHLWCRHLTDTRGGKTNDGQRWDTEVEEYYDKLYNVKDSGKPLEMTDFAWVFSTPQLTRSYAFAEIYCHETDGKYRWADEHPWNNGTGELLPKYFAGKDFT